MSQPVLHITSGDPTGIGPELIVRGLKQLNVSPPKVYGHLEVFRQIAKVYSLDLPKMEVISPKIYIDPIINPGKASDDYQISVRVKSTRMAESSKSILVPMIIRAKVK